ncbi:unnamed protein product [Anisakis simplex]|uniref:Uncharacterized protein n=1 Tax=Anisakis simplex TaxID=6269 RepID=A0A0M3KET9_ANISI|nr:unnamed protein product [Anisakis simplex]
MTSSMQWWQIGLTHEQMQHARLINAQPVKQIHHPPRHSYELIRTARLDVGGIRYVLVHKRCYNSLHRYYGHTVRLYEVPQQQARSKLLVEETIPSSSNRSSNRPQSLANHHRFNSVHSTKQQASTETV